MNNIRIAIICEGNEEIAYLKKLKELKVFNASYTIKLINSKSITRIFPYYTAAYRGNYEVVLIFCDTDDDPKEQYMQLKEKIRDFHELQDKDINKIIYFGNPCTMQIILSHFAKVKIKSRLKSENALLIEKYCGVKNYSAKENEINGVMKKINKDNYEKMKLNLSHIPINDSKVPSTNFLELISVLEKSYKNNKNWFNEINKIL